MRRVRINSQKRAMIFDGHKIVRQVRNDQILSKGLLISSIYGNTQLYTSLINLKIPALFQLWVLLDHQLAVLPAISSQLSMSPAQEPGGNKPKGN